MGGDRSTRRPGEDTQTFSPVLLSPCINVRYHFWLFLQLGEILKFGVDKLLSSDESSVQDVDLKLILGQSDKGHWLMDEEQVRPADEEKPTEEKEIQSRNAFR